MLELEVKQIGAYQRQNDSEKDAQAFTVSLGYQKYYLFFDNCNAMRGIIYFAIVMFDKFIIPFDCDISFWKDFIKLYTAETHQKKSITFTGIDLPKVRGTQKTLLYSGGIDSEVCSHKLENTKHVKMQFISQAYPVPYIDGVETFSTNMDDVLFHNASRVAFAYHRLEIFLPIILNYKDIYMGIEYEAYQGKDLLDIDLNTWFSFFSSYRIRVTSMVDDMRSVDILKYAVDNNLTYVKCGKIGSQTFCLKCEKCLMLYIEGANYEEHGFPRVEYYKMLQDNPSAVSIQDLIDLNWKNKNDLPSKNRHKFFTELYNKYKEQL